MALIRYPGSKEKLADQIFSYFPDQVRFHLWASSAKWEYREPFFGSGAIGFRVLDRLSPESPIWINDIDKGIVSLWQSVHKQPQKLLDRIARFKPSAEAFYEFKSNDGSDMTLTLETGFRKLALHQMSVSGFGAMSGGPLGGRNQENAKYPVDCRWNPERLRRHVVKCHKAMRRFPNFRISHGDFSELIDNAPDKCCVYLDPPYVEKGKQLYKYNLEHDGHLRLRECLAQCGAWWVLSYDDHHSVRELYGDCDIKPLEVTYTNAVCKTVKRPKNGEIVIFPKNKQ